jgi:hypothetical protein
VNHVYETGNVNIEVVFVCHDLLGQPNKFFEYSHLMPETFNYISI